jgi:hypothetical protein
VAGFAFESDWLLASLLNVIGEMESMETHGYSYSSHQRQTFGTVKRRSGQNSTTGLSCGGVAMLQVLGVVVAASGVVSIGHENCTL